MQEKNRNITQFTDKYEFTNPITRAILDNFFKAVLSLCPKKTNKVLEVGCGAGYSTKILYEHIKPETFHASDIDPELVKLAKERTPQITAEKESIYELPHKDNSFDLVFTLEVLEHLEDPEKALKELKRVTNKYIIVSVPHEPIWRILNMLRGKYLKHFGNTEGHINHWSKRSFTKLVGKHFKVIKVKTPLPWIVILAEKNEETF
ncbi:MAG: class I SAM-dependent methyltransferase [Patescibacteria group bacterium]